MLVTTYIAKIRLKVLSCCLVSLALVGILFGVSAQAQPAGTITLTQPTSPAPGEVNLSWSDTNDGAVTHTHKIYRALFEINDGNKSSAQVLSQSVSGTETTYQDTTGIPGEDYYYAVSAFNQDGEGPVSNSLSITVSGAELPHGNYQAFSNLCRDCHKVHQAPPNVKKIVRKAPEIEICYVCHDGSGSSYNIRADFEHIDGVQVGSAHDEYMTAPAESNIKCMNCHHPHGATAWPGGGPKMTRASEEALCYQCHNDPANSESGINIYERFTASTDATSHHDLTDAEQAAPGYKVECVNCHDPHVNNRSYKIVDPDNPHQAFTATAIDPSDTEQWVSMSSDKDTYIDKLLPNDDSGRLADRISVTSTKRGLVSFDLSNLTSPTVGIPPGSEIRLGELWLWCASAQPNTSVQAHRVTPYWWSEWATWNYRNNPSEPWDTPGGDFDATPETQANVEGAVNTWVKFDIKNLVEGWVEGTMDRWGMLLKVDNENDPSLGFTFASRDYSNWKYRPRLRIIYANPPAVPKVDQLTFCEKCHDGTYTGAADIATKYNDSSSQGNAHGARAGSLYYYDHKDDPPRSPYYWGEDALFCTTCHDMHGSSNIYHLKEELNGFAGISVTSPLDMKNFCVACHSYNHNNNPLRINCPFCHSHSSGAF